MKKLSIGLLPLYIKLYDDHWPELRTRVEAFHQTIISELEQRHIEVLTAKVCRIHSEVQEAVDDFEEKAVDAIVTLHLAYSPSLESANVLAASKLPLLILDTTPTFDYSPMQHPDELFYNHGIHGVQDLCNILLRMGKSFTIEVGHWSESDVLDRLAEGVKSARIAKEMKTARVGRIGNVFAGMGDFDVPIDQLRTTIGIETIVMDHSEGRKYFSAISDEQIDMEIARDRTDFHVDHLDDAVYRPSTQACLTVRTWIEQHKLTAFTANFLDITQQSGVPSMPFLEASKAMARGTGYAGEGDVLTAALVGALLSVYPETSFTEMFCPDWKGNRILLSHMGEMNVSLTAQKPLLKEMSFPFTDASRPIVAYGRFRGGAAAFVNLAPGRDQSYSLIIAPIEMMDVEGEDRMEHSVHGWFRPSVPIADFLSAYSQHGGTHHGAIVYGDVMHAIEGFGRIMGWNVIKINS